MAVVWPFSESSSSIEVRKMFFCRIGSWIRVKEVTCALLPRNWRNTLCLFVSNSQVKLFHLFAKLSSLLKRKKKNSQRPVKSFSEKLVLVEFETLVFNFKKQNAFFVGKEENFAEPFLLLWSFCLVSSVFRWWRRRRCWKYILFVF